MKLIETLFSKEVGTKVRAVLAAVGGLVVALILVLQSVLDVAHQLPDFGPTATVTSILVGAITYLGRFTNLGDPKP